MYEDRHGASRRPRRRRHQAHDDNPTVKALLAGARHAVADGLHHDIQRPAVLLRHWAPGSSEKIWRSGTASTSSSAKVIEVSQPTLGPLLRGAVDLSTLRNRPVAPAAPRRGRPPGHGAAATWSPRWDGRHRRDLPADPGSPRARSPSWWICGRSGAVPASLSPILENVVRASAGRLVLAKVDVNANPRSPSGFPCPVDPDWWSPLWADNRCRCSPGPCRSNRCEVFARLLQVAAQNGAGLERRRRRRGGAGGRGCRAHRAGLLPAARRGFRGHRGRRLPRAITAYEKALAENPRDEDVAPGSDR